MAHLVFCCSDAREAYRNKELCWSAIVGGWMLTTVPLRSQTSAAKWFAWERHVVDCSGLPYRFDACPFCRSDTLPYGPPPPDSSDTDGEKDKGEGAES